MPQSDNNTNSALNVVTLVRLVTQPLVTKHDKFANEIIYVSAHQGNHSPTNNLKKWKKTSFFLAVVVVICRHSFGLRQSSHNLAHRLRW